MSEDAGGRTGVRGAGRRRWGAGRVLSLVGWSVLVVFAVLSLLRVVVWDASWVDAAIDFGILGGLMFAVLARRWITRREGVGE